MLLERIFVGIAVAGLSLSLNAQIATAGDFLTPTAAPFDGSFRNTRLSLEDRRKNHSNVAKAQSGSGGGGGTSYDEYQQTGTYQNVIWIPMENIGEGAVINVNIGETEQTSDGSTITSSNTVCDSTILNTSGNCGSN